MNSIYKIYFPNFNWHSANESNTFLGAKKIAREAGFDSIIELNGEAVCTYSVIDGFVNVSDPVINLDRTG